MGTPRPAVPRVHSGETNRIATLQGTRLAPDPMILALERDKYDNPSDVGWLATAPGWRRSAPKPLSTRSHFVLVRASSRRRRARAGLNTPQEQNRCRYVTACSGVRRPSFTQSIILLASDALTMPWPHMVAK